MLLACPHCAAQMPETAAFCPSCGRPMERPASLGQEEDALLAENVAAALAYFTFIPAILFLVVQPYKKQIFVRFHSVQCLLLWGASIVVVLALRISGPLFFLVPVVGPLLVLVISVVVALAAVLLWLVLIVKSLQREMFKLPLLGRFAAEYSGESKP